MTLKPTLEKSHEALLGRGVSHALIGGLALAVLGVARATDDVDYFLDEFLTLFGPIPQRKKRDDSFKNMKL